VKVLIVNTLYYPNQIGGAERSVQLLAEGLLEKGVESIVVCTSNRDYINYVNGVKVYYVKISNLYWPYETREQKKYKKPVWHFIDSYNPFNRKVERILDNEEPDIVHTNNLAGFSVSVWKLVKRRNIKIVHTLRDYYLLCPKSTMFKDGRNCGEQCGLCKFYSVPRKLFSNSYVDGVVGVSKFILNRHLKLGYFRNSKIRTWIYNPILLPKFVNLKKVDLRKEIVIGLVGLMAPAKGTEFALECFRGLDLSNARLVVYGKGITKEYEEKLRSRYSCEKVVFKGYRKPEEIYGEIDVSIIPSLWHEPFPRVLIESFSYGVPVIASNRGGIPESIIEEKTGFIFDPDKKGDLESKLEKMLSLEFDRDYIRKSSLVFSRDSVVEKYIRVYEEVSI